MRSWHFAPLLTGTVVPEGATDNGLISIPSKYSVPETLDRLESIARKQGLTVFARIDFSGDAQKAGLTMKPSGLLLFGNPKAGTPLMVATPTIAIDLPLKALAWEDPNGRTWLSYNKPEYLKERHGLPDTLLKNISGIKTLVEKAVE
jgi:uncharacterized protein (DUF302 family)